MTDVHVLGVRHHGPGSARAVAEALDELRPDLVLVEGPPELDALTGLVADPDLRPPVAALVYAADRPQLATFYPVADFSPEWVAKALVWLTTDDAADLAGQEVSLRDPEIRRRAGVA